MPADGLLRLRSVLADRPNDPDAFDLSRDPSGHVWEIADSGSGS